MGWRSNQLHIRRVMRFIFIFRFLFVYPFWHLLVSISESACCGAAAIINRLVFGMSMDADAEARKRERQTEVHNINIHRNLFPSVNICHSWTSRLTYVVGR